MRKVTLLLCVVAALLVASQASASLATWQEEPVVLPGTGWTHGPLPAPGINRIDMVEDLGLNQTTVTIWKVGPEFVQNGDLEQPYGNNGNLVQGGGTPYLGPQFDIWRALNSSKFGTVMRMFWPDGVANGGFPAGDKAFFIYTRYLATNTQGNFEPEGNTEYKIGYPGLFPRTVEAVGQTVPSVTFDPNVPITMSADIGRFSHRDWNGAALQIAVGGIDIQHVWPPNGQDLEARRSHIAGGTVIAEASTEPNVPAASAWAPLLVTYDASDPAAFQQYAGLPIQVRCAVYENPEDPNYATSYYAAFDNIVVTIDGQTEMADAPDPVVEFFSSTGDIEYVTVYDDACEMSRAIGTLAGDIDEDCDVDIADLSSLGATWLALPESTPVELLP